MSPTSFSFPVTLWEEITPPVNTDKPRGTWVAQSVKCLTSAQVMISWLVSSSPADSSEPGTYFRFCVSLSLCPAPACILSLSFKNEDLKIKKKKERQAQIREVMDLPKVVCTWHMTQDLSAPALTVVSGGPRPCLHMGCP